MMRGFRLVSCDAELKIGVIFVGTFSFLSFASSRGTAVIWVVGMGTWWGFDGERSREFAAEDLDSALGVNFLHALFFGGFFGCGGGFIALDFGDVVLVVDVPGLLS
jgi:hypothetical protein